MKEKKIKKNTFKIAISLTVIFVSIVIVAIFLGLTPETSKTSITTKDSKGNDVVTYHDDGSVSLPEGYTANGLYDPVTDKIIDSGTTINLSGNILQERINFQQNFPSKEEYLLIVLIDYVQHDFELAGQHWQSYPFTLEGESTINFDISVMLGDSEGTEFSYMIIPRPEEKSFLIDGAYNWDTMFETREWIVSRFPLDRGFPNPEEKTAKNKTYNEFQAEGNVSGFEMVNSRSDLTVAVEGNGGETLELVMLNQAKESQNTSYIILGFLDWQQFPINGDDMEYYVTVASNTSISIPITLPNVQKPMVLQMIAFEQPGSGLAEHARTTQTTFRVLVKP